MAAVALGLLSAVAVTGVLTAFPQALGLTIPQHVLLQATEVIQ